MSLQLAGQLYKLIIGYILEIWQEIAFKILISVCPSAGDYCGCQVSLLVTASRRNLFTRQGVRLEVF